MIINIYIKNLIIKSNTNWNQKKHESFSKWKVLMQIDAIYYKPAK